MIRQAVVAAGGKGSRLGALAKQYGNKSLIPIQSLPILAYTLEWLKESGMEEIIVTVNYMDEYRKIAKLFEKDPKVCMAYNRYRKGSNARCIPPLLNRLDSQFLFVYGHAPAPSDHLQSLMKIAEKRVAVSLYPITTQGETKRPAQLSGHTVALEASGLLYIEPPFVLDHAFVKLLAKTQSWRTSFQHYPEPLVGVRATHPSESHYKKNFVVLRKYMTKFLKGK